MLWLYWISHPRFLRFLTWSSRLSSWDCDCRLTVVISGAASPALRLCDICKLQSNAFVTMYNSIQESVALLSLLQCISFSVRFTIYYKTVDDHDLLCIAVQFDNTLTKATLMSRSLRRVSKYRCQFLHNLNYFLSVESFVLNKQRSTNKIHWSWCQSIQKCIRISETEYSNR